MQKKAVNMQDNSDVIYIFPRYCSLALLPMANRMHVEQKFENSQLLKVPPDTTKILKMSSFTREILELSIACQTRHWTKN